MSYILKALGYIATNKDILTFLSAKLKEEQSTSPKAVRGVLITAIDEYVAFLTLTAATSNTTGIK